MLRLFSFFNQTMHTSIISFFYLSSIWFYIDLLENISIIPGHDFFYWTCPILASINYSSREIVEILTKKGYSCGKSTVNDAINRYTKFGSPLQLKRGRPRVSGIGKCTENCQPIKMYDRKKLCTHQLAENNTYAEVATMLDCTPRTVFK